MLKVRLSIQQNHHSIQFHVYETSIFSSFSARHFKNEVKGGKFLFKSFLLIVRKIQQKMSQNQCKWHSLDVHEFSRFVFLKIFNTLPLFNSQKSLENSEKKISRSLVVRIFLATFGGCWWSIEIFFILFSLWTSPLSRHDTFPAFNTPNILIVMRYEN